MIHKERVREGKVSYNGIYARLRKMASLILLLTVIFTPPVLNSWARLYGLPKLHKVKDPRSTIPPFRPIVSSVGIYNYNFAKYLCSLLKPHVSSEFCATDTFSFVKEIQDADFSDMFMVSYDVTIYLPTLTHYAWVSRLQI